jgi:hypothetical protein
MAEVGTEAARMAADAQRRGTAPLAAAIAVAADVPLLVRVAVAVATVAEADGPRRAVTAAVAAVRTAAAVVVRTAAEAAANMGGKTALGNSTRSDAA